MFARIVALVAAVALLTSRVMLLVHEFGGHGAPAVAFGGRITGFYLFLFAGGRVSYEMGGPLATGPRLIIGLGGIALELALGTLAFVIARWLRARHVMSFCFLCVGTMVVGHAAIYLARGVHYGYGDGAFVARLLGATRWTVVAAASAIAMAVAFFGGRRLAELPAAVLAGTPRRVAALTLLAFVCAGAVHGALAFAEIRWFPDPVYVKVMENASAASARVELGRRLEEAQRRGEVAPSSEERERMLAALERERRPWPLDPLLGASVLAALAAGVVIGARQRRTDVQLPSWRAIATVTSGLVLAVGVIIVLRQVQ
jgi:hypothetical protein